MENYIIVLHRKLSLFCIRLLITIHILLSIGVINTNFCKADSLFVHREVSAEPLIPRLTRNVTTTHLDRGLLCKPFGAEVVYFWWPSDFPEFTIFVSDLAWGRVTYGNRSYEFTKDYGNGGPHEKQLGCPGGLCFSAVDYYVGVGHYADLVVVDRRSPYDRIINLRYSYTYQILTFYDSLSSDSDQRTGFSYIAHHNNKTTGYNNSSDDYFWVVDKDAMEIVKYVIDGTKGIQRIESLPSGDAAGEFCRLGAIVCGREIQSYNNDDYVYILDPCLSRVTRFYDNGSTLSYSCSYQFETGVILSDIEVDYYGQVCVLDELGNRIYKFSPSFVLYGVYDPGTSSPNGLYNPRSISNPRTSPDYGLAGYADMFIGEEWTESSGGQWLSSGLKLIEQAEATVLSDCYTIEITYSASDPHNLAVDVWQYDGSWALLETVDVWKYSGQSMFSWTVPEAEKGESHSYKFGFFARSTYLFSYSGEPTDSFDFEVQKYFGNKDPYFFDDIHIVGATDCILYGDGGYGYKTLKSCALDADPPFDQLLYRYTCSEGSFVFYGSGIYEKDVIVNENTWTNLNWYPPIEASGATSVTFGVTVFDQKGGDVSSQVTYDLASYCGGDPDPPCPTLYVQTERGYEIDNNILSASEDTEQPPGFLRDFYLLQREPDMDENGYIHLQLREDEQQTTTFDGLKLTVAWVDEGREIGVSDQGAVFYPIQIKTPVSVSDGSGDDRLQQLDTKDGNSFTSHAPGELIINFGKVRKSSLSASAQDGGGPGPGLPPPDKDMEKISPYGDPASGNILRVDVMDESGNWVKTGIVPPRKFASFNYIDLGDWVREDKDLWVRLRWDHAYSIDHLACYDFNDTGIKLEEFAPATVSHSSFGDTRESLITNGDDATTTLSPGEVISLSFGPIPQAPEGKSAKYVLTCTGRYTTDGSDLSAGLTAPEGASLNQNTPNPFNASTVIEFSLPHDGNVRFEVYDVLGRRVRLLIDDNKPAGYHSITWNGRDDGGVPVASGIYFYRLTTEDFAESRKMILVK